MSYCHNYDCTKLEVTGVALNGGVFENTDETGLMSHFRLASR